MDIMYSIIPGVDIKHYVLIQKSNFSLSTKLVIYLIILNY